MTAPGRRIAAVAPVVVALTGWIAVNPYFFWGSSAALFAASVAVAFAGAVLFLAGARPRPDHEWLGIALLTVFLVYATVLPRVDGGHTKWIFVLPTLWTLGLMDREARGRTLDWFAGIFALSLVPGILISLLAIAGAPLTLRTGPDNPAMGSLMLNLPGALFLERNSLVLPWGGVLFRMCGIYDEPGTVGTSAAFLLAAYGYRLTWRTVILYAGGLFSFSLAFLGLTVLGLVLTAVRRPVVALAALPLAASVMMVAGFWAPEVPYGRISSITIRSPDGERVLTTEKDLGTELRQLRSLDNRVTPQMAALLGRYASSDFKTLAFGIASDASVVHGGVSQTWKRLFTDFGALGFALFAASIGMLVWARWRSAGYSAQAGIFLIIFCLSIYQRPIVWMPYALVMLLSRERPTPK